MKKATQLLSITLSSALVLTSAPWPAAAIGPVAEMPAFAQALAPAESLGYVASSYSPTADATRPRLIVIADLHAHVEVQHHIVDMLDGLVNKLTTGPQAQKQVQIFVEGGWQPHLEHPLASVQNPKLRSIMAEYFLQKAEIPATQAFSERHPNATNFTLTGVENKDEYDANRARFLQSYPVRKRLLEAIARHEDSFKELSGSVEARSYQKLQDMREAYQAGSLSGDRYARALVHQASHFGIADRYVDILQQPNAAANPEFDLALTEVNRNVSARLAQSRPLTALFRGDEKTIRENVSTIDAYLDLLKRTLGNQLTPEEVPMAYARIPQMAQAAQILIGDESLNIDISNALEQSLAFYPFAFMRNDSLVENSLATLQKGAPTDTGILVVGGFHSEAISQYLQEHQIAYLLINPIVSRDLSTAEQLNYVERIAGDHVTTDEARADFSHPMGQAIVTRASTSVTPISDLAGEPVVPGDISAAPEIPAVEKAITPEGTPKSEEKPDDKGTDAYGGESNPFYAQLTAAQELGIEVVNQTKGVSLIDGVEGTVLTDAVQSIIRDAKSPIEAQLDPTQSARFNRDDAGVYTASGPLGEKFSLPVATVLHQIPESERAYMPDVYIQKVDQKILAAYSLKVGQAETPTQADTQNFVTVHYRGKFVILYANEDPTGLEHELAHAFGLIGFRGERRVQAIAVKSTILQIAENATVTAGEHALTLGLTASSIPTKAVLSQLSRLNKAALPLNFIQRWWLSAQVRWASQNGTVSLSAVSTLIDNAFKADAAHEQASQQVDAMKARLMQQFPDLKPEQADQVLRDSQFMLAGFAVGGNAGLYKRAIERAKKITAESRKYLVYKLQA